MSEFEYNLSEWLSLKYSDDKIQATVKLKKDAKDFSAEDIRQFLSKNGIVHGIKMDALEEVCTMSANESIIVAEGDTVVETVQPVIDYFFPMDEEPAFSERTDGSVDFKEARNFNNFEEGAILAIKTPGTEGTPGKDVFGKTIKSEKLKDKRIQVGKFVGLSEDGLQAVAKAGGHVCRTDGKITILTSIRIPGDIDYSIGNIYFMGDVEVAGTILADFKVEVGGNLKVRDNIENADLKVGKDLTVGGNVFGHGECQIIVGGNASFRELDSAKLDVTGNLQVKSAIRQSNVTCGGNIEVISSNGVIVGGEVRALKTITTPNLGNTMGTLTKISVGTNPFYHRELDELDKRNSALKIKYSQIKTHLDTMKRKTARTELSPSLKEVFGKLKGAESALNSELSEILKRSEELREKLVELSDASVKVKEKLYTGVVFSIRYAMTRTYEEQKHVVVEEEGGEIKFFSQ